MSYSAAGGVIGAIGGAIQSYQQTSAYKAQLSRQTASYTKMADLNVQAFKASTEANIFTQWRNEEEANNAMAEVARAGMAQIREAKVSVKEEASKISAQSEGITAGTSKARELSSFYVKASKGITEAEKNVVGSILQIKETEAKANEQLQEQQRNDMFNTIKSIYGGVPNITAPSGSIMMGSLQGFQTGQAIGKNLQNLFATNTEKSTN